MNGLVCINRGTVLVECPNGCRSAYAYVIGQTHRTCDGPGGCGTDWDVIAPPNLMEIMTELMKRPNQANRNWYPVGHFLAEAHGIPMGQTPEDLAAEFAYHRDHPEEGEV